MHSQNQSRRHERKYPSEPVHAICVSNSRAYRPNQIRESYSGWCDGSKCGPFLFFQDVAQNVIYVPSFILSRGKENPILAWKTVKSPTTRLGSLLFLVPTMILSGIFFRRSCVQRLLRATVQLTGNCELFQKICSSFFPIAVASSNLLLFFRLRAVFMENTTVIRIGFALKLVSRRRFWNLSLLSRHICIFCDNMETDQEHTQRNYSQNWSARCTSW